MKFIENKKIYSIFLIFSFFLVFFKIFCQTVIFELPVDLTTLLFLRDSLYFPLIDAFSELNFNPSYSENNEDLNLISYPILGLIINIIFYFIFDIYSFLILEFLCVVIFLSIFFNIFLTLNFSKQTSIFLSFLLFFLPIFFEILGNLNFYLFKILELNFSTFYSLRFPRPIISNLYLFGFLLFYAKLFLKDKYFKKNLVWVTILMSLTLHSFFYLFIFQSISIILLYLYIFKTKVIHYLFTELKFHLILLIIIFFNLIVFQLQLFLAEKDYVVRLGVISLDTIQKKILLDYFLNFFLRIEFLSLLIINSIFFLLNTRSLKIFYFFFLSTILGTIFFILISNKGVDYYHFNNWIITSGILNLFISIFYLFENNLFKFQYKFKKFINIITLILVLGIIFQLNYRYFKQLKNNLPKIIQYEKIEKYLISNKNNFNKKEILSLDHNLFYILINNDYKNFSIVPNSFWTSKKDIDITKELFGLFNFFDLNQEHFLNFFENTVNGYRIRNSNTLNFFGRKYLANQIKIFDSKEKFTDLEKMYIKKHSPIITHQLIIPDSEYKRFKNDFKSYTKELDPSILILEKKDIFFDLDQNNSNSYCLDLITSSFKIYISKKIKPVCN